jgi:hypothetical protein
VGGITAEGTMMNNPTFQANLKKLEERFLGQGAEL